MREIREIYKFISSCRRDLERKLPRIIGRGPRVYCEAADSNFTFYLGHLTIFHNFVSRTHAGQQGAEVRVAWPGLVRRAIFIRDREMSQDHQGSPGITRDHQESPGNARWLDINCMERRRHLQRDDIKTRNKSPNDHYNAFLSYCSGASANTRRSSK